MAPRPLTRHRAAIAFVLLYALLATPTARRWLEATMTTHMLVQIPLLAAIGIGAGKTLPARARKRLLGWSGGAIPCVTAALFASGYWMLPRALDAALASPPAEAAKFLSLPLLVGLPLALAWRRLTLIGRGFVWTNLISMLAVLGWLYIAAPVRACSGYLVEEQVRAGWRMIELALALFVWWLAALFVGGRQRSAPKPSHETCESAQAQPV